MRIARIAGYGDRPLCGVWLGVCFEKLGQFTRRRQPRKGETRLDRIGIKSNEYKEYKVDGGVSTLYSLYSFDLIPIRSSLVSPFLGWIE